MKKIRTIRKDQDTLALIIGSVFIAAWLFMLVLLILKW